MSNAEEVRFVDSGKALSEAISFVLGPDRAYEWEFKEFIIAGGANHSVSGYSRLVSGNLVCGIRGTRKTRTSSDTFVIRYDYDFKGGMPSDGGKGYHINVHLPNKKVAFATTGSDKYFYDACQMLTERKEYDGDEEAARWFMSSKV